MRKNTGAELWGMDEFRGGHSTASHMCDAAVGRCISCLFLLRSLSVFSLYSLCTLSVSRARARSLSLSHTCAPHTLAAPDSSSATSSKQIRWTKGQAQDWCHHRKGTREDVSRTRHRASPTVVRRMCRHA